MPRTSLADAFASLRSRGERALIPFVTGGDPSLEALPEILKGLEEAGADAIEIGLPFSDPIADGPSIQASSQRALDRGVTPLAVLERLKSVELGIPLIAMGYINPMLRMGFEAFAQHCVEARISGVIVCDVIPEEAGEWCQVAQVAGLETIFLAAPTSSAARLDLVVASSKGFVYAVARTGVTGAGSSAENESERLVADLRARTELPVCVGFGISQPEHVRAVCGYADGAIVGSALVQQLATGWDDPTQRASILSWVRELKAATRGE